jgi:hypothetical protein
MKNPVLNRILNENKAKENIKVINIFGAFTWSTGLTAKVKCLKSGELYFYDTYKIEAQDKKPLNFPDSIYERGKKLTFRGKKPL